LVTSFINIAFSLIIITYIPFPEPIGYNIWLFNAVVISIIVLFIIAVIEIIFYRKDVSATFKMVKNVFNKRKL